MNSREKKMTSRNKIHIYFARQLLLVQIGFTCDLILQKDDLVKKKKKVNNNKEKKLLNTTATPPIFKHQSESIQKFIRHIDI